MNNVCQKKNAVSATLSVKENRRMKEEMKKHCIYQNKWDMNRTYKPTQRNKTNKTVMIIMFYIQTK